MSELSMLKNKGIQLPPIETEDGLTASDIMNKIRNFYLKFQKYDGESADFMECYFLELLRDYPKSICARHMTESIKQLINLYYFSSKPEEEEDKQLKDPWPGYSYEDLAVMFDLSKATIHEAIRQKEAEVKKMLDEIKLREKAKAIGLRELVEEEKQKLRELKVNNQTVNETSEQTPFSPDEV